MSRSCHPLSSGLLFALLLSLPVTPSRGAEGVEKSAGPTVLPQLKQVYHGAFYVGVAMNAAQAAGKDQRGDALIDAQFNSISPENALKWDHTEPRNGQFTFDEGDAFVAYGEKHGMAIIGHNLVWHSQLPSWVSEPEPGQAALTREVLLQRLRRHIMTVAGRYKGRILGWDVVNEAILDGSGDYRDSIFYRLIGKEYLVLAFKWAHEADPHAELYYNEYNLDQDDRKRDRAVELVKYLRENGAPIDGIGLQGHYNLTYPSAKKIDETIRIFAGLGLKVMITELDVQAISNQAISGAVGAFPTRTPPDAKARKRWFAQHRVAPKPLSAEQQAALAARYGDIFRVFWDNRAALTRVTLWGLRDADSWRRYSSPLLFDDNYQPKPAFYAVVKAAQDGGK